MYMEADEERERRSIPVPFSAGLALATALFVTVGTGLFPGVLAEPAGDATPALVVEAPAEADATPAFPTP
jgi:hypothetical protein